MPPLPSVTLLDVARAAKVSRTTASAALGGSGRISEATREHVQNVALRLGYVANPAARHLKAGRKGAIAVYVPDVLTGYAFYMDLAFGAVQSARQADLALTLVAPVAGGRLGSVLAHVDAFLVVDPLVGDPFVEAIVASGVPVVSAERIVDGPQPTVTVETDHEGGLVDMLDHLWTRGARAPALLNLDVDFAWTRLLPEVYARWCAERGVEPRVRSVPPDPRPERVRDVTLELLDASEPPDAIVSAPDGTALGVLGAARVAGRTVGEDLLVATCVDSLAMQLASPPLTALVLRPRDIGRDAAATLIRVLAGEELPSVIRRGRPELVVRDSTGAGAAAGAIG